MSAGNSTTDDHYGLGDRSLTPELLFRRHYRNLVTALAVASGSRELAADAVQEAFVQLCKKWDKISRYERPEAWLMRVAVNRARSEQRSLGRRAAALLRLGPPEERVPAGLSVQMVGAFRSLPARQRLASSLFYLTDLSLQDVAQAMGISEGAAGTHLYRAR